MVLLRLGIGIALIGLLLWVGLLDVRALAGALLHPPLLIAALAVLFGTLLIAATRWQLLLRVQGIRLPGRATLRVVLAAAFFSTFLPGALGGDLVRSGYIIRAAHGRASTGLLSLLMDRVLGLAGLLVASAMAALAHPAEIPRMITIAIWIALAVLALAGIMLPRLTRRLARRVPPSTGTWRAALAKWLHEINSALAVYRRAPLALLAGLALSMLICAFDVAGLLLVMRAMSIDALPWIQQALACMLALIANNLPFTPGGLGVGEAAFANAALALESVHSGAPYATAFLAYRCMAIIATLPGAFLGIHVPARPEAPRGTATNAARKRPESQITSRKSPS
ncbi:MAG TPA: lysylphosphatidylglycerol synthase transmembrane domain-containing protein [Burkholderiales bacterium]